MQVGKFNETVILLSRTGTHLFVYRTKLHAVFTFLFLPSRNITAAENDSQTCNLIRSVFLRYKIPAMIMTDKGLQLNFHWIKCSEKMCDLGILCRT